MQKFLHPRFSIILFLLSVAVFNKTSAQTVQIIVNPTQSANIVIGSSTAAYHVSEYIYTETEIGASNFTTAGTAINHIDFNIFAIGTNTVVNNYNVYFKEVPLTETTFTTGAYDTAGYTKVFSGTYNAATLGWTGIDLTTTFVRTAGNNLKILIERLDNTAHGLYSFNASQGNSTDATLNSNRRISTNTLPVSGTTVLTASRFRPQIQLRHVTANDAALTTVYTLGKLPIPFAAPHVISANVVNNGSSTLTNLDVTLDITGANIFSNIKTIASLAPGVSTVVYFDAFNPAAEGLNTVTVSVPADDFSADNTIVVPQEVTSNAYTYAYGTVPNSSVGLTGTTGDFAAMFTTSSPTSVNQVGINFATGGQSFRIAIWDKSGTGKPGTLLWESTDQVTTAGVFTLPISPAVAITDTFYIGVRQIGTVNIQFAYQNETPIRPNTFFLTFPTGNPAWTDFAPGNPFKFMIEPRLTIANDVGVSNISNPVSASSIDNCGILPQATISNFGSNNQTTPFDVTFIIKQSGNVVYSDTKQTALNSGESNTVYFAPFTGSVTGSDSSFVITQLTGDGAANNDTVVNKFTTGVYSFSDSTINSDGYSYANSTLCASLAPLHPVYNWITQTDNQINWGTNGDDSVLATPISLPFPFKFFDNTYNQFWISSNGWISFSDPTSLTAAVQRTPVNIPAAGGIENYIAGIFADLDNTTATFSDAQTFYGADASGFVITFSHAHLFGSAAEYITFQIILKVNGDILIQYNDAESTSPAVTNITNFCSVGIENANGTKGILYRRNGSGGSIFGSPLALQFYKRPLTPVAVTLLRFTVEKGKYANKLLWTTAQEINSREFIIERSNNGIDFTAMGTIAAKGNSNQGNAYSFIDEGLLKGINYYRLKMVNADGSFKYSAIVNVRNEETAGFVIYPNPVKDKMTIRFTADKVSPAVIHIFDVNGKLVYSKNVQANEGANIIKVDAESFVKGSYILKMEMAGDVMVNKFTKF